MATTSAETGLKLPGLAQKKPTRGGSLCVGQALDGAGRGKIVAVRDGERHRHSGAGGQAGHITPVGIDL